MTRAHDLGKICGKVQYIIMNQDYTCICIENPHINMTSIKTCSPKIPSLCTKGIHQSKKAAKNHVRKPILVLNYLKTFSKIVHLIPSFTHFTIIHFLSLSERIIVLYTHCTMYILCANYSCQVNDDFY